MGLRVGMLALFMLGLTFACDARRLDHLSEEVVQNDKVCALCEEYVEVAVDYLEKNQTQSEIIEALHDRCSRLRGGLKQQCIALVDYYVPLFFLQLESFQPQDFCRRLNLCEKVVAFVEEYRQNSCDVCHRTVSEILDKLQDPEAQLDIIAILMKGCKSLKNYEKQCKKLVFEYGPVVLVNAEAFLVKNDVCTILRACHAENTSEMLETAVMADS